MPPAGRGRGRGRRFDGLVRGGQVDGDDGSAAGVGRDAQDAAELVDDAVDGGQPEPAALAAVPWW